MDRYWLLTWTTYGTRLPGDTRGFVSQVLDRDGSWVLHNRPGTPLDSDILGLYKYAAGQLKSLPVRLIPSQANVLLGQFRETADFRVWHLLAAGIMANHCHLTVGVPGDPAPSRILGDFKSYASRALNRRWAKPISGTWWTDSGSTKRLPTHDAILGAVNYILQQEYPLVIWTAPIPELNLRGGRIV